MSGMIITTKFVFNVSGSSPAMHQNAGTPYLKIYCNKCKTKDVHTTNFAYFLLRAVLYYPELPALHFSHSIRKELQVNKCSSLRLDTPNGDLHSTELTYLV